MEVIVSPQAEEDLKNWAKSGEKSLVKKAVSLIEAIQKNPFEGVGKPEQLKHQLSGLWSRRINREHRVVYQIVDDQINVLSVKGHY